MSLHSFSQMSLYAQLTVGPIALKDTKQKSIMDCISTLPVSCRDARRASRHAEWEYIYRAVYFFVGRVSPGHTFPGWICVAETRVSILDVRRGDARRA